MNLLTVKEVADQLATSEEAVRRLLRRGELIGANLGGRSGWRVREEEVEIFVQRKEDKIKEA